MSWHETVDPENPYHLLYVLLNDKTDVLARVETFDGGSTFYPWVMDVLDPTLLRRVGPVEGSLRHVRSYCEAILSGSVPQEHGTASEPRPMGAGLPD